MNQLAKHPLPQQVAYKPKLFRVSLSWNTLFKKLSLNPEDVANLAQLPTTIFKHSNSNITPEQYICIWNAIEQLHTDNEYMGLEFAQSSLRTTITMSVCALLFSENLSHAITNLNNFQALMMPAHFHCEEHGDETTINVAIDVLPQYTPRSMSYFILVFLVELLRVCTGERIIPLSVQLNGFYIFIQYRLCRLRNFLPTGLRR